MPTRHFTRFDPSLTPILTQAFDSAWATMQSSGVAARLDGSLDAMREAIALRIVEMAESGLTNPSELAVDALAFVTEKFPDAGEPGP